MVKARKAVQPALLAAVRASLGRMQTQAERILARVRRDAEVFATRSRGELVKEVRNLERRVLKAVHAATREDVARLERRIAKLESRATGLGRPGGTGSEQAA